MTERKIQDSYNDEIVECDGSVEIMGDSGRVLVDESYGLVVPEITEQAGQRQGRRAVRWGRSNSGGEMRADSEIP